MHQQNKDNEIDVYKAQAALTETVSQRICEAVRFGATDQFAARFAGVRYRWLRRWIKTGKQSANEPSPEPYQRRCGTLYADIEKARGDYIVNSLYKIEKAGGKDWKALAWKLRQFLTGYHFSDISPHRKINRNRKKAGAKSA